MRRIVVVTRILLALYAILAIVSAGLAVGSALRGQYGSAALNAVLALVWWLLFRRLWRRGLAAGAGGRRG